jgi:hypothetical protein
VPPPATLLAIAAGCHSKHRMPPPVHSPYRPGKPCPFRNSQSPGDTCTPQHIAHLANKCVQCLDEIRPQMLGSWNTHGVCVAGHVCCRAHSGNVCYQPHTPYSDIQALVLSPQALTGGTVAGSYTCEAQHARHVPHPACDSLKANTQNHMPWVKMLLFVVSYSPLAPHLFRLGHIHCFDVDVTAAHVPPSLDSPGRQAHSHR